MMDVGIAAMERLIRTFQRKLGIRNLVYHSGVNTVVLERKAWTGRTAFRISDISNEVSRIQWSDRDIFIPVADLSIGGNLHIPLQGDWMEIDFPEPYGLQRFEVSAPDGEQIFRYSDPQAMIYRIHVKRMRGS